MDISSEQHGDIVVLRASGRVDAVAAPQLEAKIQSFIDAGHKRLLLNFSNVDYLSSAGMRLFLSVTKKLEALGEGRLVICSLSEEVMEVIKMAGFHQILHLAGTEEQALASFSQHP